MVTLYNVICLFVGVIQFSGCLGLSKLAPVSECAYRPISDGEVCRVFMTKCKKGDKSCNSYSYADYVPCVPKKVDKKCAKKDMRVILKGSPDKPQRAKPLRCNKRKPCPMDSKCVRKHCCYSIGDGQKPNDPVCNKKKCPPFTPIGIHCALVRVMRECNTDADCQANKKCCFDNECGGTSCKQL